MKKGYDQFGNFTRIWLSLLLEKGKSYRAIGAEIGKHHTTIIREIQKYSIVVNGKRKYDPLEAQKKSDIARFKSRAPKIDQSEKLMKHIEEKLKSGWSPDAIAGDLKRNHSYMYVSHEAI